MGFPVYFYSFSKRENSTARPAAGTGREFSCVIRTESGITSPHIEIDLPLTDDPSEYNYAYIPAFGRYYHVEEWLFAGRLWSASLSVDVLATAKTEIGAHQLYVLRAAADYDGRVCDSLYPTKSGCTFETVELDPPWSMPSSVSKGCYIIGTTNRDPNFGSNTYYIVQPDKFNDIVQSLMDNLIDPSNGFSQGIIDEASEGLLLSLVDPLQYIKSVLYFPIDYDNMPWLPDQFDRFVIYNYTVSNITGQNFKTITGVPEMVQNYTIELEKHPQTSSRGNYVNQSPYTLVSLYFPPFGVIELDTTVLCNTDEIEIEIKIDVITGMGILKVLANGILLNRLEAQIAVPIQLSQVTRDYLGAFNQIMGAASGIASGIGNVLGGNIAGGVGSFIGSAAGVVNAGASLVPRSQSTGGGGSYAQLSDAPRLDFQFFEIVDDDITQNGRPLCQMRTPASLGGYMLIQDGDVPTTLTATENRKIKDYLESGFYYE